ncbi:hypothetical protein ACRU3B_07720 [Mycobacterium colombiense]|nr:hypothetical protein [Mycobacterium colombiense]MCK8645785.1 hypothetical protein [Mycobacterium colombiense]
MTTSAPAGTPTDVGRDVADDGPSALATPLILSGAAIGAAAPLLVLI